MHANAIMTIANNRCRVNSDPLTSDINGDQIYLCRLSPDALKPKKDIIILVLYLRLRIIACAICSFASGKVITFSVAKG